MIGSDEWSSTYFKFLVELEDGPEPFLRDLRRLVRVPLLQDSVYAPILELVPDAFMEPVILDAFDKWLTRKKIAIKASLLLGDPFVSGTVLMWCIKEVIDDAMKVEAHVTYVSLMQELIGSHPKQYAGKSTKWIFKKCLRYVLDFINKAIALKRQLMLKAIFERAFVWHLLASIFTWNRELLMFSLPRPPEVNDLEDNVVFEG
ncbi:hypothetical protein QQ045_013189 [Rhodiola kirilowii]